MQEKYYRYALAFQNLDTDEKKEHVLSLIREIFTDVYKVNGDLELYTDIFERDYETDDEFLNLLFNYLVNLKYLTEENMKAINNEIVG